MPKERELYRVNLERVVDAFNGYPELIGINDVAKWLGVKKQTLLRDINTVKVGNRYRVSKSEIARYLSTIS